jgi:RNA polymerase sigma factor (sigma-70 family)
VDPPSLLPHIATNDREATRECIERYGGLVWSLVRRAGLGHEAAEEVVKDVFLDLWQAASRFDPTLFAEPTFVTMIVRRRLVELRQRGERRPLTAPLGASSAEVPTPPPSSGAEAAKAAAALGRLSPEERQVLVLAACQGLSHEEIAHTTGMALATVRTNARRGLLAIRNALGGTGHAEEHR